MVEVNRLIIDTTKEHTILFNVIVNNIKDKNIVTAEYIAFNDILLDTANRCASGDYFNDSLEKAVTDLLNVQLDIRISQYDIDLILNVSKSIMNYYVLTLINLKKTHGYLLFVRKANNRGIFISEYNVKLKKEENEI